MLGRRHIDKAIDSVATLEQGKTTVKLIVFLKQLAEWFTLIVGAVALFNCVRGQGWFKVLMVEVIWLFTFNGDLGPSDLFVDHFLVF